MGNTCYIVGAGGVQGVSVSPGPGDLVIAADGGWSHLKELGLTADIVVGDFDSLGYVPSHPNCVTLPTEKDDTDMLSAVRLALGRGYRHFVLLGGLGGRLDHTLANLQVLSFIARQGGRGELWGEGQRCTAVTDGTLTLPARAEGYVSVFAQGGDARGVTLEGLKYTLEGADLTCAFPIGVSNEFVGEAPRITVEQGTLLVLWQV